MVKVCFFHSIKFSLLSLRLTKCRMFCGGASAVITSANNNYSCAGKKNGMQLNDLYLKDLYFVFVFYSPIILL